MSTTMTSAHEDMVQDVNGLLNLVDDLCQSLRGAWAIVQQVQVCCLLRHSYHLHVIVVNCEPMAAARERRGSYVIAIDCEPMA
jgi:hypothetical protein